MGRGKCTGTMGRSGRRTREADKGAKMKSITSRTDLRTSTLREGEGTNRIEPFEVCGIKEMISDMIKESHLWLPSSWC